MKKGIFICFIGIDGSGKSTLAKRLVENLEKHNVECKYLWWLEGENSILRKILRFLARLFFKNNTKNNTKNKIYSPKSSSNFVMLIYQYLVFLDYLKQIILKTWFPILFGKVIIYDRYIYDTIIAFSIEFNYSKEKFQRMTKLFSYLSPNPDVFFLVDVPEEVALKRKNDISSIKYLTKPKVMYNKLSKQMNMKTINGTKSLEELNSLIWHEVSRYMERLK